MSRRRSPTDLTNAQWAMLEPDVPPPTPGGRPPKHSRRERVDAMRYIFRSGGAWRVLPHEFPPWQTVSHYFRIWRDDGSWERINTALRERVRSRAGRDPQPRGRSSTASRSRPRKKGASRR